MKKEYTTPRIYSEQFVANEYVAACWNIKCNVPSGIGYIETNGISGYQRGNKDYKGDKIISSGYGCGTMHEAHGIDAAGPVANAMWQEDRSDKYYPVFYFRAKADKPGDKNDHFCTLDSVNWEKNPNASN